MSDRELTIDPKGCEECGKHPAWDFPWCGSFCAACAGLDKKNARQRRAEKRAAKRPQAASPNRRA